MREGSGDEGPITSTHFNNNHHHHPIHKNTYQVRWLLGRGADVGAVDDNGLGALHYAAMRDRSDVVALLLASGADPLVRDDTEMGYTPLHVCVHYDARGTLAALLADEEAKKGIDTVYVDGGIARGDFDVVHIIIVSATIDSSLSLLTYMYIT